MAKAPNPRCEKFIASLNGLSNGEKARLKRNAGNSLAESHKVHDIYWRIRPCDLHENQDDVYFLVATLFPFVEHRASGLSFGRTLKSIVNDKNRKGLDKRFAALLDADEQQLPHRLRQLIMRFKGGDKKTVDWVKLLDDLAQWHHPDRYIQPIWAKDYFVAQISKPKNATDAESLGEK